MKYTVKEMTEAQIAEVVEKVVDPMAMIGLDMNDVKLIVEGHEGLMFEGTQDENETSEEFLTTFFKEIEKLEEMKDAISLILSIQFPSSNGMIMMEEMNIVNDFMSTLPDSVEARWGLKANEEDGPMTVFLAVATRNA